MALPSDVSVFTLTFGAYSDATGQAVFAGMRGRITPSATIRHAASGSVIVQLPVEFTIRSDGTAQVSGLVHTDQALQPAGFTYLVDWLGASDSPSPGRKRIAVPVSAGSVVDFDTLELSPDVEGVSVPIAASLTQVTAAQAAATAAQAAATAASDAAVQAAASIAAAEAAAQVARQDADAAQQSAQAAATNSALAPTAVSSAAAAAASAKTASDAAAQAATDSAAAVAASQATIVSATINGSNRLILTTRAGGSIDAGYVKGDAGTNASISIGTVTTGAAGAQTAVSNRGTSGAAILDFTIPQGAKGDPGDLTPVSGFTTTGAGAVGIPTTPQTRPVLLSVNSVVSSTPTPPSTSSFTVTFVFKQAATGSPYTLTWPSTGILWAGSAPAPAMPTAANARLLVHLFWTGAEWLGMVGGIFQ